MIYRGLGFLAVVLFVFPPTPLSRQQVVALSQSSCLSPVQHTTGEGGGGGGREAKSYEREKSLASIHYSILSVRSPPPSRWTVALHQGQEAEGRGTNHIHLGLIANSSQ
jgi:hypothetical protein